MSEDGFSILSLCAGIGGLDLAAAALGGVTKIYAEIAEAPRAVLEAQMEAGHLHRAPIVHDMTSVDWRAEWGSQAIDAIVGGIPCQGHSHAGKRLGAADPRNLWPSMFAAVEVFQPRLVLLENVRGILSSNKRVAEQRMPEMLESILTDLASVGYRAAWTCVYASEVGAPHIRDRFFLLAERAPGDAQRLLVRRRGLADGVYDDPTRAWPAPRTPSMEQLPHEPPRTTLEGRGRALRLRCLGNAVLPAQAVLALERLREMLSMPDEEPLAPYQIVTAAGAQLRSWPASGLLWVHRCSTHLSLTNCDCPTPTWKAFARTGDRPLRWAPEGTPWPTATTGGTGYRSGNRRDVWRPTLEGAVQGLGPQRLFQGLDRSEFYMLGSLDEANAFGARLVEPSAPWPTPDASASNVGESPESWEARRQTLLESARGRSGNGAGTPLGISVHLPWPTPTASDAKASGAAGYPVEERSPGLTLTDAADQEDRLRRGWRSRSLPSTPAERADALRAAPRRPHTRDGPLSQGARRGAAARAQLLPRLGLRPASVEVCLEGVPLMSSIARWAELEAAVNGRVLVGMEGVRDPDFRCEGFRRADQEPKDARSARDCDTDGHYLCDDCIHISDKEARRRRGECACGGRVARFDDPLCGECAAQEEIRHV